MKQAIVTTCILMIIGWIIWFPKNEQIDSIDSGPVLLDYISLDIKGAVLFPGVYHFFNELTMSEAISYAGGFLEDADLSGLQLSEIVKNSRQIIIKSKNVTVTETTIKVNINKASFKDLLTIPYMTETKAASLIVYREAHGSFKHIDEVLNVKNIGVVTLEKIKPYITLG